MVEGPEFVLVISFAESLEKLFTVWWVAACNSDNGGSSSVIERENGPIGLRMELEYLLEPLTPHIKLHKKISKTITGMPLAVFARDSGSILLFDSPSLSSYRNYPRIIWCVESI